MAQQTGQPARKIGEEPAYTGKRRVDFSPFAAALNALPETRLAELDAALIPATLSDMQHLMADGRLTAVELATYYITRIRAYDVDRLQSVGELNPEALDIARRMDEERKAGRVRGPLHGIPLLLKDNIGTGDLMHTTAGAKVLEPLLMDRDAFIVKQLRDAGVVILGKANMSEWAYWMDDRAPSGFSVLGGQVRCPHGPLQFDPSGSSSGSAVAVAAKLIPISIGTETCGSISAPSSANGIVGLKPTVGMVSRDRIIPITATMDTAGPMARHVRDAAILFGALVGVDPADLVTHAAERFRGRVFNATLSDDLRGLRVGLIDFGTDGNAAFFSKDMPLDEPARERITAVLRQAGAELVPVPVNWVQYQEEDPDFQTVLGTGFKHDLNALLRELGDFAPVNTLAEVIAFNNADLPNRAPYGQDLLEKSDAMTLTPAEFNQLAARFQGKYLDTLRGWLTNHRLDALLTYANTFVGIYATAGCPALTVPGGLLTTGQPFGVTFVGDKFSEPTLLRLGYALEQRLRRVPLNQ